MNLLLVDDEKGFVDALAERLELRGFTPGVAYDAASALEAMAASPAPMVVLDLLLPDMHGREVLQRIMDRHPETRVVVLTGHGSEEDRWACMELGAVGFLRKPVDINSLAAALRGEEEKA